MTKVEEGKLPLGLYRLFWKSGGWSLSSVGQDQHGNKWIAPVNWSNGAGTTDYWKNILRVEWIETQ